MTNSRTPAFIGLDIETTGLDPHVDYLLEVGIVIFDDNLWPIDQRSWLLNHPRAITDEMNDLVRKMHTDSGLLGDLASQETLLRHIVEEEAIDFIAQHTSKKLPMVGSSVTFDRSFLDVEMPDLLKTFHYRSVDATSVLLGAIACEGLQHRDAAEKVIGEKADIISKSMLRDLSIDDTRPHRPIYDLCQSAALVRATNNYIYESGAGNER